MLVFLCPIKSVTEGLSVLTVGLGRELHNEDDVWPSSLSEERREREAEVESSVDESQPLPLLCSANESVGEVGYNSWPDEIVVGKSLVFCNPFSFEVLEPTYLYSFPSCGSHWRT